MISSFQLRIWETVLRARSKSHLIYLFFAYHLQKRIHHSRFEVSA
jgi:hypothetical protein